MTTIVNFKTAKLLKEKGFDNIHTSQYIHYNNNDWRLKTNQEYNDLDGEIGIGDKIRISAPTIDEVKWWLYEKHGIWIYVSWGTYYDKIVWYYYISTTGIKSPNNSIDNFNSPTEACQQAISYTLKSLIQ